MKISKVLHVISIAAGFAGTVSFAVAILGGTGTNVFGITKIDTLLCAGILLLIAIWVQLATMHHDA